MGGAGGDMGIIAFIEAYYVPGTCLAVYMANSFNHHTNPTG